MKSAGSRLTTYAPRFPAMLRELRDVPELTDPGLVLGLHALLRASGLRLTYGEADVISGQATQFLYSREQPECAELSFVPPADTLFRSVNATWKEVTPSGPATAIGVLKEWIGEGYVGLARFREPLLIIGYEEAGLETSLIVARITRRLETETISESDCDKRFWRYPLDEGNVLIRVESVTDTTPDLMELARTAARRAAHVWRCGPLAGCYTGEEAYRELTRDLADAQVDFTVGAARAWAGRALWRQWSGRRSAEQFFDRMAPRFGGQERAAMSRAAFFYSQSLDAWKRFAGLLAPTWDFARDGFDVDLPESYLARWRDPSLRLRASRWVEEAGGWEAKAVGELVKVIG